MVNYSIGDFLIRVKNAGMAGGKEVVFTSNKLVLACAQAIKKLGYLEEVKKDKDGIKVTLAIKRKEPVLMNLKLISKPGLRVYMDVAELKSKRGASNLLISTSKGIMSHKEAIKMGIGGEALAEIW
ncbi:MAG: 30S ribosomal protein S8 [Patescibacteria group bacterium]